MTQNKPKKYAHVVWEGTYCRSDSLTSRVVLKTDVLSPKPMGEVLVVEHLEKDAMGESCWKKDRSLTVKANDQSFLTMVISDMAKACKKYKFIVGAKDSVPYAKAGTNFIAWHRK